MKDWSRTAGKKATNTCTPFHTDAHGLRSIFFASLLGLNLHVVAHFETVVCCPKRVNMEGFALLLSNSNVRVGGVQRRDTADMHSSRYIAVGIQDTQQQLQQQQLLYNA